MLYEDNQSANICSLSVIVHGRLICFNFTLCRVFKMAVTSANYLLPWALMHVTFFLWLFFNALYTCCLLSSTSKGIMETWRLIDILVNVKLIFNFCLQTDHHESDAKRPCQRVSSDCQNFEFHQVLDSAGLYYNEYTFIYLVCFNYGLQRVLPIPLSVAVRWCWTVGLILGFWSSSNIFQLPSWHNQLN